MKGTEDEPGTEVQQENVGGGDEDEIETDLGKDLTEAKGEVESKDEEAVSPPDHPYIYELSQFKPHSWQLEEKELDMYFSLGDTKFTMVDTQSLLEEMMVKLKEVKEMAIDMEYHSFRSFPGKVCLVQISTRAEDFIIDSLLLKNELIVLNEVCTDSNILKVLHHSKCYIEWLQKDFGVYVINMLDTHKAARVLQEEVLSMAGILKKYCKVEMNKEYQRADWRVRPLPYAMVKYARQESHYLLYVQDVFRNSLLKRGKGTEVLEELYTSCTTACGEMWHPDKYALRLDSYLVCSNRIKGKLNVQQLECFRLLYEWRHKISREKDESMCYTLPDKLMKKIARKLPKEAKGVIECCDPVPPLVQENLEDVHKCILQAIKNVPEVPKEPVNIKKVNPKGKPSQSANTLQWKGVNLRIGKRGGFKTNLRGGVWNRGRPGGGSGFRNFHGRGARHMGPPRMHPYAHPPPRRPLPYNLPL